MYEFIKFLSAGGTGAAANIVSRYIFNLLIPYEYAIVLAYLVGMVTMFLLSKFFVFTKSRGETTGEIIRFSLVNLFALILVYIISITFARYVLPFAGIDQYTEDIAHVIGVCSTAFTSYLGHRYITFKGNHL